MLWGRVSGSIPPSLQGQLLQSTFISASLESLALHLNLESAYVPSFLRFHVAFNVSHIGKGEI